MGSLFSLQFFPSSLNVPILIVASAVAAGAILSGIRTARSTTLVAPSAWALVALTAIVLVELLIAAHALPRWMEEPVRFLAAVGTFCPLIGLLGAKRPQDSAWFFIVLSLWGILIMPSLEVLVLQPGQSLEVHDARQWFLVVLVVVGLIVGVPTAMGLACVFVAAGQLLLFHPQLPLQEGAGWDATAPEAAGPSAVACFAIAALWWRWRLTARRPTGWSRVWLDFRDWYGLLWALRVAERVNAVAQTQKWSSRLGWRGFVPAPRDPAPGPAPSDTGPDLEGLAKNSGPPSEVEFRQVMMNLLRRFVSESWVDERLGPDAGLHIPGSDRSK